MCHVVEGESESKEDDANAQDAFAAKFESAAPLFGEVSAEGVGKEDAYEDADNEGREGQVFEKGKGAQGGGGSC